jgi:Mn-dependent DtxR family transcriptional regulator
MLLTPAQEAILKHLLTEGDDTAANIADKAGMHRNSISRAAKPLKEEDLIKNKGRGVYRLTSEGREEARDLL